MQRVYVLGGGCPRLAVMRNRLGGGRESNFRRGAVGTLDADRKTSRFADGEKRHHSQRRQPGQIVIQIDH